MAWSQPSEGQQRCTAPPNGSQGIERRMAFAWFLCPVPSCCVSLVNIVLVSLCVQIDQLATLAARRFHLATTPSENGGTPGEQVSCLCC